MESENAKANSLAEVARNAEERIRWLEFEVNNQMARAQQAEEARKMVDDLVSQRSSTYRRTSELQASEVIAERERAKALEERKKILEERLERNKELAELEKPQEPAEMPQLLEDTQCEA